jgi:hypothetical protein
MDDAQSEHVARLNHLREAFAEANGRLVARLRRATDDAAMVEVEGGWSAAQIGWHVATVTTRFAGLISGEISGAQPLAADFRERPWEEIASSIPERASAPSAVKPPARVRRADAIDAREASAAKMALAFDVLTLERGRGQGITNPMVGTINVYQIAEWATAHVKRHNRQAKRALGEV